MSSSLPASADLQDVLITSQLATRPVRIPDFEAENRALVALATTMTESPSSVLQKLAETALELCKAGSAGVSVWEPEGRDDVFRWRAAAGEYAQYLGGTMPRGFSPCGAVLDRNSLLLMADPIRYYPYISALHAPVREVLLMPFHQDNKPIGTVWIVAHTPDHHFDAEDARIVSSLTQFAGASVQILSRMEAAERAEQAQRKLAAELTEAGQRKDEFLATLAHELRNPLAPIRSGLSVLQMGSLIPEDFEVVGIMDRQVGLLSRLVDDLLDVSRLATGKVTLRRECVSVRSFVETAVEASRLLIQKSNHCLTLSFPDDPIFVDADPTRMSQVMTNLLNNAAKYTSPGGRIALSVERDGGDAVLHVADNGVGIPAHLLPRVFDTFMQVGSSLERSQGGLGLGLTLVRKLVEMHGGTVTSQSEGLGKGSTFSLRLRAAALPPRAPVEPAAIPPSVPRRVLAVDDNVGAAVILKRLICKLGDHTVELAHDGPTALARAREFCPDVILLDIGLPGMDGYQLAQALRSKEPAKGAFLVALTGYGQDDDRRRSREAGFDHHVTKPIDIETLRGILCRTESTN